MVITIDGPAGGGKTTVASRLAKKIGYYPLKTGLLYRALAYMAVEDGLIQSEDLAGRAELDFSWLDDSVAQSMSERVEYGYREGEIQPYVCVDGNDVTEVLSSSAYSDLASIMSALKPVREALLDTQRKIAHEYDVIAEGRDCGSVVFPDAAFKFYLTASVETRAQRILADPLRKSTTCSFSEMVRIVQERDARDSQRDIAPLCIPHLAHQIDSSSLTVDMVVDQIASLIG